MKNWLLAAFVFCLVSCGDYIAKPKNLLKKDQMAEILVEMVINEQSISINASANLEAGTRYILKKRNVKGNDFVESYKYYAIKREMEEILKEAQEKLLEKYPDTKPYVKQKMKEESLVNTGIVQ